MIGKKKSNLVKNLWRTPKSTLEGWKNNKNNNKKIRLDLI